MSRIIKISFAGCLIFCNCFSKLHAQNYSIWRDFLESNEVQPASARAAAMGYAQVANGGTIAESRINPAGLGLMPEKLQTEVSYSWPAYVDKSARLFFIGAGYKINDKLSVAVSRFGYSVKNPVFGYDAVGTLINIFFPSKVTETFYTGSASYEIIKGLYAGVNLNYFSYTLAGGGTTGSFLGDAGVLYQRKIGSKKKSNQQVTVAASFTNLNMAKTKWKFPDGSVVDVTMSSHLYAGASYTTAIDLNNCMYGKSKLIESGDRFINFLFQLQYEDFVHMKETSKENVPHSKQAILSGINAGAEILLLKTLALRFGYRHEKRQGDETKFGTTMNASYPYVKGFTFGTGLQLPLNRLTNSKLPFDLCLDYVHRNKAFKWLKDDGPLQELPTTNIDLRLNWHLK